MNETVEQLVDRAKEEVNVHIPQPQIDDDRSHILGRSGKDGPLGEEIDMPSAMGGKGQCPGVSRCALDITGQSVS